MLTSENIEMANLSFVQAQMSPRQVMNYVKRQQAEGYAGKSARAVLEQWADYLDMCRQKKKDTTDEMVYRPRELKRRHNELVEEMRKERMLEQLKRDEKANEEMARKMAEKYPGAEKILEEIRDKYDYQNEEYMMIVPRSLVDIAIDGSALHHCTGGASVITSESCRGRHTSVSSAGRLSRISHITPLRWNRAERSGSTGRIWMKNQALRR